MKHLNPTPSAAKGFSLVEMLVVIAVIGIIAAIAIPNIGNVSTAAKTASNQRNAQSIVSMYEAGSAAGIVWGGADRNAQVAAVIAGAAPADGPFQGKIFKVPNMDTPDTTNTYPYIGIDAGGGLFYDKAGGQPAS